MDNEQTVIDPTKIKMTKTYSMSLDDVNKVKEMAMFKETTDAAILHLAIDSQYKMIFPETK